MATKSTKADEIKLDIQLKGVKAKLQTARVALLEKGLNKTGKNDFAHFEFFQLKDFLPEAQRIFTKLGLTTNYTIMPRVIAYTKHHTGDVISEEPIIRDIARLIIKDIETEEIETFEIEAAPVQIGNNTKQNIYQAAGGRSTYYKRYLYRDALEIEENDESDEMLGAPNTNWEQPTIQVTPYDFQQPVNTIQQAIVEPAQQMVQTNQQIMQEPIQIEQVGVEDSILTDSSRIEIMNLVGSKGLDGSVIISYCEKVKKEPASLLESDKQDIINYINSL